MAEFLSKDEIRTYPLSNGTSVDLIEMIAAGRPEGWRKPVIEELAIGQTAYVPALGNWRRGVITKVTETKVYVTFTTQGAIDHQARYRADAGIRVQTTVAGVHAVLVAPLSLPVQIDIEADHAEAIAGDIDRDAERQADREEREGIMTIEEEGEGGAVEPIEDEPAAPLDPITGSAIVAVLEETWEAIRAEHPDLPHVVIVTGSGFIGSPRWAHWRESGWTERQGADEHAHSRHGEMFVAGEALAKGAEHVVESMLHEGAHTLATAREIQDTSRQGRWHNDKFRKLAQELGLEYRGDKADPTHGFSNMLLTDATREKYADLIKKLDAAIRAVIRMPAFVAGANGEQAGGEFIHGGKRPKTGTAGPSTNNLKLTCCCVDEETGDPKPRIIRASKKEAERGQMMCGICREFFEDRSGE